MLTALLTTAALLLAGLPAHGYGSPADSRAVLRVRVALPDPLAGASAIVIVSPAGAPERPRTAVLERARLATFDHLAPDSYEITVTVPGGATASGAVTVEAMEIVTMTATIAAGGGSSALAVTDRQPIGDSLRLDGRALRDLPATAQGSALVETVAPFVVVDHMDGGGLATARSAFMGSRGASWTATTVVFGEQPAGDTGRTGLAPLAPELDAASAAVVTHGLAPVDVATPGTHVRLVPRDPGLARHGTVRASFTSPGMVGTNALPHAPSIARMDSWRDAGATFGGPLSGTAGLVVSGAIAQVRLRERGRDAVLTGRTTGAFSRAVLRPTLRDQVSVDAGGRRLSRPFDGRAQFADRAVQEAAGLWQTAATWARLLEGGAHLTVTGGVQRQTFTPDVGAAAAGGVVDRVFDGVMPEPAAAIRATQWHASAEVQPATMRWGHTHHGVRAGALVRGSRAALEMLALPPIAETVAGEPARVWVPRTADPRSVRTVTSTAFFVEDRIDVASSLTVTAGARFDIASGSARGAARGILWQTASPRVSFRWNVGPLSAFGGVGDYVDPLSLSLLAYGDPGAPAIDVHRWTDPDGNRRLDAGEIGTLLARAGAGAPVAAVDAALRAPRTREWTVGGELPIARGHRLRGTMAIRRQTSLPGLVNTGLSLADYRKVLIPDANADWHSPDDDHLLAVWDRRPDSFGRDALLLTSPERATASYEGIEIVWDFQSERWRMLFGATAYRAEGFGANPGFGVFENDQGVIGAQYASPNAAAAVPGRLFFDRAYVGKWSVSYHGPGDVRVAAIARYQDGQPFARLVVADLSTGPEVVQAYAPGRTRFTYTATVDARVEKGFRIGGARAAVLFDVFNLTNHANEVEEDPLTRATFRLSTAVQPPLTMRLGIRVAF